MRWLARTLLVVLLILGIGLPVAWMTRDSWAPQAAKWSVNSWAARQGLDGPAITDLEFSIDSLSLDRLALSGVQVNGPDGFSADQVAIGYDWRDLLTGRVRSVALEAPRLALEVHEGGAVSLGPLEPLRALAGTGGEVRPESASRLPVIRFANASLLLQGLARGRIDASGTLGDTDGTVGIAADASGAVEGSDWRMDGAGRFQASFTADRTRLNATLTQARLTKGDLSAGGLRGTAAVDIDAGGEIEAIADLRADRAEARGVAVAVPSAHLRMDPLGLSAVFRLGDRESPDLRLAVSADQVTGERRPVAVDLDAELATLDRLVSAARRKPALGATGRLTGTLRGTMPAQMTDIRALWIGAVAAGGLDLSAATGDSQVTARFGAALAAGTLALETRQPARLSLAAGALQEPLKMYLGEGPLSVTLGDGGHAFRLSVREPFATPKVTIGGAIDVLSNQGATAAFKGDATLDLVESGPTVTGTSGTVTVRGVEVDGARLRSATLVLDALDGGIKRFKGNGLLIAHVDAGDVRDLRLSLPLRLVQDANGTAAFLERQGSITVPGIPTAGSVASRGPVTVRLEASTRPALRYGFEDPDALRLELPILLPALDADIDGGVPLRVAMGSARGLVKARFLGPRGGAVLSLETPTIALSPADEDAAAPDGIALADVSLEVRASTGGGGVTLDRLVVSAGSMTDRASTARFAPLRLDGTARRTRNGTLEFTSTLGGADGAFVLDAKGVHDVGTGRGRAHITVYPLVFVPGGLQPVDLSPAASAMLRNASGRVSLAGAIEWPGRDVPPDDPLTLTLADLAFTGSLGTVSGLTGAVAVSSIDPLTTLMGQTLTATGIDVGVPIAAPQVAFHIDSDLNLVLERVQARFADGTVQTENVTIPMASNEPVSMVLDVAGVDAARLAEVTELEGLTATGTLTGRLPLVWDFVEGLSVREARLTAVNPGGTVKYRPETPPPALQDSGEEVSLLMDAVRNLVYERFEIEANGRPGEPFDIRLKVRGANPDLFDGYPVALNVSLTGRLDEMFLNARRTLGLSDVLRRKLEARNAGG